MPLCKDRAAKELADKGYSLVKYPRLNIAPLDIIAGERSPLDWLGPLNQIWTGKSNPPTPIESSVPAFTHRDSDEFKGSIGIKILQGLIKNIGGNVGASLSISSSLSFTYDSPKQFSIAPFTVGAYLKDGDLDSANPVLKRYLEVDNAIDTRFYVITEVLRARKLLVRIIGSNSNAVTADAAAVQGLASGNASITKKSERENEITFDGNVDLTFAFRAYELGYVEGKWTVIGSAPKDQFLAAGAAADNAARFGDRPVAFK